MWEYGFWPSVVFGELFAAKRAFSPLAVLDEPHPQNKNVIKRTKATPRILYGYTRSN